MKQYIVVLNFIDGTVDFIESDKDFKVDCVEEFLVDCCNYSISNIEYMITQEKNIKYKGVFSE